MPQKRGKQLSRISVCLCKSKSVMQKIDAAAFYCIFCLMCFKTTSDRWPEVSDTRLPSIPAGSRENKWGHGDAEFFVNDSKGHLIFYMLINFPHLEI